MTSLSRLVATATLITAAALAPRLAAADDRFHGRDDDRAEHGHRHGPACDQPPGWAGRGEGRPDDRGWERAGWRHEARGQRHAMVRALRRELAELDRDRATFHARFADHPRRLARYDERWLQRRAVLEQELQRLTWYAWR